MFLEGGHPAAKLTLVTSHGRQRLRDSRHDAPVRPLSHHLHRHCNGLSCVTVVACCLAHAGGGAAALLSHSPSRRIR